MNILISMILGINFSTSFVTAQSAGTAQGWVTFALSIILIVLWFARLFQNTENE